MNFQLTSTAFQQGQTIPRQYTGDGQDISPPLKWSPVPEKTKSLALICDDPDAPAKVWVHWVIYDIPPSQQDLKEHVPTSQSLADGSKQGKNDFGKIGYGGPAPPPGKPHRYYFKLYALDQPVSLQPGATKEQLLAAMQGHIVGEAQLMGIYKR